MNTSTHILNLADQCVKCGMCLPHCPTYQASHLESESPRGRIAIIQGLLSNQITGNLQTYAHINNCLSCRACEKVCPSNVQYGKLLDNFKYSQAGKLNSPSEQIKKTLIRFFLSNTFLKQSIVKLFELLHLEAIIGISKNTKKIPRRQSYDCNQTYYPSIHPLLQKSKKIVAVFIGCTGNSFDRNTLNDVIFVLTKIGFEVKVLKEKHCCGAMDSHAGRRNSARKNALQNINAMQALNVDHICYFASGCGAQLIDYQQFDWDSVQQQNAEIFTSKLIEISKLLQRYWPPEIRLAKTNITVAIHEPCSHRNVLRDSVSVTQLLSRIPELSIATLTENKYCCGAAGDYMYMHAKMAQHLRANKIKELSQIAPDRLITTNIGCALFLRNGLQQSQIIVTHPISLIADLLLDPHPDRV